MIYSKIHICPDARIRCAAEVEKVQILLDALLAWLSCIGIWRLAQLVWNRLLWTDGERPKGVRGWLKKKKPTL